MTTESSPPELVANYERRLDRAGVSPNNRPDYRKWVRFYLVFCQKYRFPPTAPNALGPFLTKLAAKNYSIAQRHHASIAIRLLLRPDPNDTSLYLQLSASVPPNPQFPTSWEKEYRDLESAIKLRNYSNRTLEAYRFWVARFQSFVRSRPTPQLSNQEVRGFLSSLAVQHNASPNSPPPPPNSKPCCQTSKVFQAL
jgi:hypothetical protein